MRHDQLTIVSALGHNNGQAVIPSILKSMSELNCAKGLLLSIEKPKDLPADIHWRQIGHLNYLEYSTFMMHCLDSFIDTEYCLVVQDDGWVLNGKNFIEDFYTLDYIGAPSHCAKVGNEFKLKFTWYPFPERTVVMNGGFSLRSKRFLGAPNRHGIAHRYANEIHSWNEDAQLTAILRPTFEDLGYRYANELIARRFAIEYVGPGYHDGFDFSCLLGHHGQSRKLIDQKTIEISESPQTVNAIHGEPRFIDYLKSLGYDIVYNEQSTH